MKISLALAGAVLLGTTLVGCGGSDGGGGDGGKGSDYCKDVKSAAKTFDSVSSGDLDQMDQAFTTFHTLADEAPSDIKDDWKTLDGAVTTLEKALKDAGVKMSDLADIQAGKVPEGVDVSKLQGLAGEMTKLSSEKYNDASKAISAHAKKTCKVDLGGTA
jgi:hypothetical protein